MALAQWQAAFAADLHLQATQPAGLQRAVQLLECCQQRSKQLFLLGDVFDLWISHGQLRMPEYQELFAVLRRVTGEGLRVVFIPGNRDFHFDAATGHELGIEVVGEQLLVDCDGMRWCLTHGDQFLLDDVKYQRYKAFIRSRPMLWLGRTLPDRIGLAVARRIRRATIRSLQGKPPVHLRIVPKAVQKCFDAGAQRVLCGHVHRAERVDFGARRELLVLPPFLESGQFLVATEGKVLAAGLDGQTRRFAPAPGSTVEALQGSPIDRKAHPVAEDGA